MSGSVEHECAGFGIIGVHPGSGWAGTTLTFDEFLLRCGERLLASRPGATIVRGVHRLLVSVAPYVPAHTPIDGQRARAFVPVEVRPSGIPGAGFGLFAASDLSQGVRIGEYAGDTVDSILRVLRLRDLSYLAIDDPCVDASAHPEVEMRYVCHHPRVERQNVDFESEGGRIYLTTTRRVASGEEFFLDYGHMYWAMQGVTPGE